MKKLMIVASCLYGTLVLGTLAFAQDAAAKLTKERCSGCHSTARICDKLGERSAAVWQQTVQRMVSNGAQLSMAEVKTVTDYIASAKPGTGPLCK